MFQRVSRPKRAGLPCDIVLGGFRDGPEVRVSKAFQKFRRGFSGVSMDSRELLGCSRGKKGVSEVFQRCFKGFQ